jgi:hypothetical protein
VVDQFSAMGARKMKALTRSDHLLAWNSEEKLQLPGGNCPFGQATGQQAESATDDKVL